MHVRVAVPELVTLVGLIGLHVSPAGIESVRVTVPVKRLTAPILIVDVPDVPSVTVAEDAETVKSVNATVFDAGLYPAAVAVTVAVP